MFCDVQVRQEQTQEDKGRISTNTAFTEPDTEVPEIPAVNSWRLELLSRQSKHLTPKVSQLEVCPKLVDKAISWLQVNSWTRGLDFETTVLASSYFYAYFANVQIPKQRLQIILATCLYTACKLTRMPLLSITDIHGMLDGSFEDSEIYQEESRLLEMLEWDAWLSFEVTEEEESEEDLLRVSKLQFLTELLLLRNCDPLLDEETISSLKAAASMHILEKGYLNIKSILRKKTSKILINKFNSKFDVAEFLKDYEL